MSVPGAPSLVVEPAEGVAVRVLATAIASGSDAEDSASAVIEAAAEAAESVWNPNEI